MIAKAVTGVAAALLVLLAELIEEQGAELGRERPRGQLWVEPVPDADVQAQCQDWRGQRRTVSVGLVALAAAALVVPLGWARRRRRGEGAGSAA